MHAPHHTLLALLLVVVLALLLVLMLGAALAGFAVVPLTQRHCRLNPVPTPLAVLWAPAARAPLPAMATAGAPLSCLGQEPWHAFVLLFRTPSRRPLHALQSRLVPIVPALAWLMHLHDKS